MNSAVHTSDARAFKRLWLELGGSIESVRQTGEIRFVHPDIPVGVKANARRKDVPAVLLSRLNQLLRARRSSEGPNGP